MIKTKFELILQLLIFYFLSLINIFIRTDVLKYNKSLYKISNKLYNKSYNKM